MSKEFFIPGNVPSSKNNKVWTGKFLVVSARTTKWRKATKSYWQALKEDFLKELSKHVKHPYNIEFTFIRDSRRRFDYVNPLQTVLDEMVEHGWLEDDNANIVKPFFGTYSYDKSNPGVIIKILNNDTL